MNPQTDQLGTKVLDRATQLLCDYDNTQTDVMTYTPDYYEDRTIIHHDTQRGIIIATLDPHDEGGPATATVYYDTATDEVRAMIIDFDTFLTFLDFSDK